MRHELSGEGFEFVWINDEAYELYYDGQYLGSFNHDEDGWQGMSRVAQLISDLAELLGAECADVGEPGI